MRAIAWILLLVLGGVTARAVPCVTLDPPSQGGKPTWTVSWWNAEAGRRVLQFHSYFNGEWRTGTLVSPEFTCPPALSFRLSGHSRRGANRVELVQAHSGQVLRTADPPGVNEGRIIEWPLEAETGQPVRLRFVDGDNGDGWAWISVCDIQPEVVPMPLQEGVMPEGWREVPPAVTRQVVDGIPFRVSASWWTPYPEGAAVTVPMNGIRGQMLYCLGGVPMPEAPHIAWGGSNDARNHFIGDVIGHLELRYQGGITDRIPLAFGFTVWWRGPVRHCPEPFLSDEPMKRALQEALCVAHAANQSDDPWYIAIRLRQLPLESLTLIDTKGKQGYALIQAVTLTGVESGALGVADTCAPMPEAAACWLRTHAIDSARPLPPARRRALARIQSALQTTRRQVTRAEVARLARTAPPQSFAGPSVRFHGPAEADILTHVYQDNMQETLSRIGPDGMVHESAKGAPNWGGPGTWHPSLGPFHDDAYTRLRALQLVAAAGYQAPAERAVGFFDHWLMYFPRAYPELQMGGKPVPGHATVVANKPHLYFDALRLHGWPTRFTTRDYGNPETDGHGMLMLARYRVWNKAGRTAEWVKERWEAIREAAEWIPWCLDNPELSLSTNGLLYAESEGGMLTHTIFCDTPCYYGLLAYAEMASAAGRIDYAQRWLQTADRLKQAMDAYYPRNVDPWGDVWKPDQGLWGYEHGILAPIIHGADLYGFDVARRMPAEWAERTRRSYRMQLTRNKPEWCAPAGFGYGQGYITESALLLDEMDDARHMAEWMARLCYAPGLPHPWRAPEGAIVAEDGSRWRRWGDLGNLYQMAETVYNLHIMAGVDDWGDDVVRIMPRCPAGWRGIDVTDWPVTQSGSRSAKVSYRVRYDRSGPVSCELSVSEPVDRLSLRLGPFRTRQDAERWAQGGVVYQSGMAYGAPAWWGWLPEQRITPAQPIRWRR